MNGLSLFNLYQRLETNKNVIVWNGWIFPICEIYWEYGTAGHLVFWKPWPVTDHIGTALFLKHLNLWRATLCERQKNDEISFVKGLRNLFNSLQKTVASVVAHWGGWARAKIWRILNFAVLTWERDGNSNDDDAFFIESQVFSLSPPYASLHFPLLCEITKPN